MPTGKLINSQLKTQAIYFDCSDPDVNFTDGFYRTDMIFKNNAFVVASYVKVFQDLSLYPAITVNFRTDTGGAGALLDQIVMPVANNPNQYNVGTIVPLTGIVGSSINNNNTTLAVQISGMTGSGITALSFSLVCIYIEMDF